MSLTRFSFFATRVTTFPYFGIGFALLAHPFWWFLCKKQERCCVFSCWGLASLCSPIPFCGSFARNKNAVALFLFCFSRQPVNEVSSFRDWLRFARPSLLGVPLQETRTLSRFSCFAFSRQQVNEVSSFRDWLRFARPSLLGVPLQEIMKRLARFLVLLLSSAGKRGSLISGLASLCSPIPFCGSFARNKNAVAFFLFCFLPAL